MTQWIVGNEDIEYSFQRLKKYGYDGIEFAAEPYTIDPDKMATLMDKYGMSCTSLCGIFTEDRDLSTKDAQGGIQYLKDCVDLALKVKAPYIIVVPSPVGRTEPTEQCPYEEAWANAVKNIRIAADYAHSKGIRLAIEAINRYETYLVNDLTKALRFVKEIDHSAVGMMADLFHMSIEENNLSASLRMIAEYLMHVHIADNTREAAGLGNTDFKEIFYVLRDINYQGPLTMEFLPKIANPYAASDMGTHAKLMDRYAEQAINYMKTIESSVI
jgi:sugar phosphate isomerase/epimerase